MKGLFPQFDPSTERDFENIWENALFVFDTNVLLNLYRYQYKTRDQLLEVLGNLSDRIWIPHHVALEFQRNRLKVIADQNNRFIDVRRVVNSATDGLRSELEKLQLAHRHSLIDPEPLTSGFDKIAKKFLDELDEVQKEQQSLTSPDPLKEKIEDLFNGRVGEEPKDQRALDEIYKRAERRYASRIAPGYMDQGKDKSGSDEHFHNGLIYKKKYGDFPVWCQLLEHARQSGIESLIFVTDDSKEDWWWSVKSDGPKTLGPRPELHDEAASVGEIEDFLMYKPSAFLEYANKFLEATVSEETLEEVRDISAVRAVRNAHYMNLLQSAYRSEQAVYRWLNEKYPGAVVDDQNYPDFVVARNGRRFGFEVKPIRSTDSARMRIRDMAHRAKFDIIEGDLDMITLVLVAPSFGKALEAASEILLAPNDKIPETVRLLIGVVEEGEGDGEFIPVNDIPFKGPKGPSFGS